MINEKLFNDLFIESHQKLAIKSLQTLNGFKNILIIGNKNLTQCELYNFQPLESCEYRFCAERIKFKLNWFYKKLINSHTFHNSNYIIFY